VRDRCGRKVSPEGLARLGGGDVQRTLYRPCCATAARALDMSCLRTLLCATAAAAMGLPPLDAAQAQTIHASDPFRRAFRRSRGGDIVVRNVSQRFPRARTAHRGRQPFRRRRQCCTRSSRAPRPTATRCSCQRRPDGDQRERLLEAALRSGEGLHADLASRIVSQRGWSCTLRSRHAR